MGSRGNGPVADAAEREEPVGAGRGLVCACVNSLLDYFFPKFGKKTKPFM